MKWVIWFETDGTPAYEEAMSYLRKELPWVFDTLRTYPCVEDESTMPIRRRGRPPGTMKKQKTKKARKAKSEMEGNAAIEVKKGSAQEIVLGLLTSSPTRFSEIAKKTEDEISSPAPALKKLVEAGLAEKTSEGYVLAE